MFEAKEAQILLNEKAKKEKENKRKELKELFAKRKGEMKQRNFNV